MALNGILANTMLQLQAPDHLRGRVMGFYSFMVLGMAPFGALQAGWVSEHFGVRTSFALGGLACVLMAALVGLATRRGARPATSASSRAKRGTPYVCPEHPSRIPRYARDDRCALGMTDEATGMLITISRQYGAGGSAVAARVAETLGWRVVDNELVERVAARAGLTPEDVAAAGGAGPHVHRAAGPHGGGRDAGAGGAAGCRRYRASSPKSDLVRLTERVVEEVAAEGRVVLVGRAAPAVLARETDAIHVKVVAPRDWRIRAAVGAARRVGRGGGAHHGRDRPEPRALSPGVLRPGLG